jgi:hypothetical protein
VQGISLEIAWANFKKAGWQATGGKGIAFKSQADRANPEGPQDPGQPGQAQHRHPGAGAGGGHQLGPAHTHLPDDGPSACEGLSRCPDPLADEQAALGLDKVA